MAVLMLAGFETGDATEASFHSGDAYSSTTAHVNGTSMRAQTAGGTCQVNLSKQSAGPVTSNLGLASGFARFYAHRPAHGVANTFALLYDGVNSQTLVFLSWAANGHVDFAYYDGSNVIQTVGSSGSLLAGRWYCFEIKWVAISTASGAALELRIDGTVVTTSGSLNVRSVKGVVDLMAVGSMNGVTDNLYFDDAMIRDDQYPGDGHIVALRPSTAGNYSAWASGTSALFTAVNEQPTDGDASYIKSTASGDKSSFKVTKVPEDVASVQAVGVMSSVRTEGGAVNAGTLIRSGSTDSTGTTGTPGGTYGGWAQINAADPATSAAWTVAAVNAVEVGVNNAANVAVRCSTIWLMVDYLWGPIDDGIACDEAAVQAASDTLWLAASGAAGDEQTQRALEDSAPQSGAAPVLERPDEDELERDASLFDPGAAFAQATSAAAAVADSLRAEESIPVSGTPPVLDRPDEDAPEFELLFDPRPALTLIVSSWVVAELSRQAAEEWAPPSGPIVTIVTPIAPGSATAVLSTAPLRGGRASLSAPPLSGGRANVQRPGGN